MINKPTDDLKDNSIRSHIDHIQQEAQGNILILSAAPTAAVPLLQDYEVGQYSTNFYWRVGGTIYVFASTSTITIT